MRKSPSQIAINSDASRIVHVRGRRVILDSDLAELYGVPTKRLNEQVRRNRERFPEDFCFRLFPKEWESLRSQFATLDTGRGQHRKFLPLAFTEHGTLMAAGVLNSPRAIEVSIFVVRTFIAMREAVETNRELAARIDELERKYDVQFKIVFDAIRELMSPLPPSKKPPIGFVRPRNDS